MSAARLPTALWAIPGVYFLFLAAELVVLTTLALDLTAQGRSALAVGGLGSCFWLGIFVASTQAHAVVQRLGYARTFIAALFASAVAVAGLGALSGYTVWLAAVALMGLGGGLVWVSGEAWLAEAAPRESRGFWIGLFETSVGLGMMAGPALLPLALAWGVAPLRLGLLLMVMGLLCAVPLLFAGAPAHAQTTTETTAETTSDAAAHSADNAAGGAPGGAPPWRALALPLAAVVAVSGLMEAGISSLLPSISMRLGFELQTAAWLGAAIGAGSALLQAPFGWLADRAGLNRAMALAWVLVLATTSVLLLGHAQPQQVLWPVGFLLGGVGGAVYTLVVIQLGHTLSGPALVRALGWLVMAYTAGTAGGPAAGGWLFDRTGLWGLAWLLMGCAVVGAGLAWRAFRPARGGSMSPGPA